MVGVRRGEMDVLRWKKNVKCEREKRRQEKKRVKQNHKILLFCIIDQKFQKKINYIAIDNPSSGGS